MKKQRRNERKDRAGAVMIVVLACLTIVSALLMLVCRNALTARRETRLRYQMQQTELLLDAGILRARKQIQNSPDYSGETWRPKNAFERFDNPAVRIAVETVADEKRITVVASLGASLLDRNVPATTRTQRQHSFRY